jgi:hypothetical protein
MDQELGLVCDNSNKIALFLGENYGSVTKPKTNKKSSQNGGVFISSYLKDLVRRI